MLFRSGSKGSELDNTLKRVPVLGGSPETICSHDAQLRGRSSGQTTPSSSRPGPAEGSGACRHYDVSPDKRFLLLKDVDVSGANKPAPPEIRIVLHWFDELNRLVPAK